MLPLRWLDDVGLDELADYLTQLSGMVAEVIVVDGSPEPRRRAHRSAFPSKVRLLEPVAWPGRNGKVAGVMTGMHAATRDEVVVADDDARYQAQELAVVVSRLRDVGLVRPQNVFTELPWHARWDTGRSLLNRAFRADYPGTFGLRRSTLLDAGGYAGDVLFKNLELIRTIRAEGGRVVIADDVFVLRRPPAASHSNVLLIGPPGVGKTHIATGLGHAAVQAGYRTYFTSAADLAARCHYHPVSDSEYQSRAFGSRNELRPTLISVFKT